MCQGDGRADRDPLTEAGRKGRAAPSGHFLDEGKQKEGRLGGEAEQERGLGMLHVSFCRTPSGRCPAGTSVHSSEGGDENVGWRHQIRSQRHGGRAAKTVGPDGRGYPETRVRERQPQTDPSGRQDPGKELERKRTRTGRGRRGSVGSVVTRLREEEGVPDNECSWQSRMPQRGQKVDEPGNILWIWRPGEQCQGDSDASCVLLLLLLQTSRAAPGTGQGMIPFHVLLSY